MLKKMLIGLEGKISGKDTAGVGRGREGVGVIQTHSMYDKILKR